MGFRAKMALLQSPCSWSSLKVSPLDGETPKSCSPSWSRIGRVCLMPALGQEHGGIFLAESEPIMAVLVLEKVGFQDRGRGICGAVNKGGR